jgi:hypothetical protein
MDWCDYDAVLVLVALLALHLAAGMIGRRLTRNGIR